MYVVPVAWIRHVADELGREFAGGDGRPAAAGLSPGVLAGDVRAVRAKHFVDFVEAAAQLARDDLFGLRLGQSYDLRASGLAAYVTITAASMREAMQNAARYGALTDTSADFALTEAGDVARFRMDSRCPLVRASRQATEFRAGFVVASCRRWVGARFRPLEVRFTHARESARREVEALLGCPARVRARDHGDAASAPTSWPCRSARPIPTSSRSWSTMPRMCWPAGSRRATGCASGWRGW